MTQELKQDHRKNFGETPKGIVEEIIKEDGDNSIVVRSDPRNSMFVIKRLNGGRIYRECEGYYTSVALATRAYFNAESKNSKASKAKEETVAIKK